MSVINNSIEIYKTIQGRMKASAYPQIATVSRCKCNRICSIQCICNVQLKGKRTFYLTLDRRDRFGGTELNLRADLISVLILTTYIKRHTILSQKGSFSVYKIKNIRKLYNGKVCNEKNVHEKEKVTIIIRIEDKN